MPARLQVTPCQKLAIPLLHLQEGGHAAVALGPLKAAWFAVVPASGFPASSCPAFIFASGCFCGFSPFLVACSLVSQKLPESGCVSRWPVYFGLTLLWICRSRSEEAPRGCFRGKSCLSPLTLGMGQERLQSLHGSRGQGPPAQWGFASLRPAGDQPYQAAGGQGRLSVQEQGCNTLLCGEDASQEAQGGPPAPPILELHLPSAGYPPCLGYRDSRASRPHCGPICSPVIACGCPLRAMS